MAEQKNSEKSSSLGVHLTEPIEMKVDWKNWLEIIAKIMKWITTLSIIFGGFVVYVYLNEIHQSSLFTNVIGQPSSFFVIVIVFTLLISILWLGFAAPHFQVSVLRKKGLGYIFSKSDKLDKVVDTNFFWIYTTAVLFSCIPIILLFFDFNVIKGFYLSFIVPIWISVKYYKGEKLKISDWFDVFPIFLGTIYFLVLFSILWLFMMPNILTDDQYVLYFFIFLAILNIVNIGVATRTFDKNREKEGHIKFFMPLCFLFLMGIIVSPFVSSVKITKLLLYPAKIVQYPDDSSWYILHNKFYEISQTQEVSGISRRDLAKIKEKFSYWDTKRGKSECTQNCFNSFDARRRSNALYGYMAWNLGNTKVFCPQSVEFDADEEKNKENAKKCLVIENQFLQPLDEQYISSKYSY